MAKVLARVSADPVRSPTRACGLATPALILFARTVIPCMLMFSIKFSDAAAALAGANAVVPVAEAHGCLSGALCASRDYSLASWQDELLEDVQGESTQGDSIPGDSTLGDSAAPTEAVTDVKKCLQALYDDTTRALRGAEMEFAPFLPDDDLPLARRAEALAQWCQGFLYGFGAAGGNRPHGRATSLPPDVEEVLRDLGQIARASAGDQDPTEEDESDYAEIVEYIRASVQLVHDELKPTLQ